ncbi:tripartite tricarboxylate transporter permease [Natronorubrum sp. FCH18a]|uniref:tripartite tricarboxylate transporter permease n=1 Tax=Natronorubrum sp. FCH18a TaxID=3447018 RepID=UPI003F51008D
MIDALSQGVSLIFSWPTIGFVILGLLIGIFLGMIPGIGPAVGMTLALPFTVVVDGVTAFVLLMGMYMGGTYGGSISAILMNVPGTAASAASTFEGYPMSRQGYALNALAISATASAIGGAIALIILVAVTPIVIEIVLAFGSPENVIVAFFGLAMITVVARGSLVKGITAGMIGILLSTVGLAGTGTDLRYTFDTIVLYDGVNLIAVILGLFAVAEMIKLSGESGQIAQGDSELEGSVSEGILEVFSRPKAVLKYALLGTIIGFIPGAGGSVANFISYSEAVRSGEQDTYGEGNPHGLIATETSNNSAIVGALLPTLSFGIPGSVLSAILLGALIMHGIQPGPALFGSDLNITFSFYVALAIGTGIVIPVVGLLVVTRFGALTKVDTKYIIPVVVVLSLFGTYAIRYNWFDVPTAIVMGIFGIFMSKHNYSLIALILGMILGPIAENNLNRTIQLSDGSLWIFVENPISFLMILGTIFFLVLPIINKKRKGVD